MEGFFWYLDITFNLMSSIVTKRVPLKPTFGEGNSHMSLGVRSGEYDDWIMAGMLVLSKAVQHNKQCRAWYIIVL
jgi:hypothetical protein